MCRTVEGVSEEKLCEVDGGSWRLALHLRKQDLYVLFEHTEVRNTIFDELGSDECTRVVPLVPIGGKYAYWYVKGCSGLKYPCFLLSPKNSCQSFLNLSPLP